MTMRTTARFLTAAVLSLGLMAGCATTGDDATSIAEQAIADAKAANADAKALGYEWRDTGKMIKEAEKALADGCADMISMARPFLADENLVLKAIEGREDEINTCIGCNQACLDHTFNLKVCSCLVNPRACHETELNYLPTDKEKKIAVVGAGPAGLAASTIAAQRGHKVDLFEASSEIGGR